MPSNDDLLDRISMGDKSAIAELVGNNMGLVYSVVDKIYNTNYDREDLIQIGSIGLIKAAKKFDTSYNVMFSTYAVPMIIGEIKRFIRDDGIIKISRSVKETGMRARKCEEALRKKLGREPTINEISEECGIEAESILEAFEALTPPDSLQASLCGNESDVRLMDTVAGEDTQNRVIDKIFIKEIISKLSKREREIIELRYFKGKTQSEIAEKIGVSQVQISRIEKKALLSMREEAL